MDDRIAQEFYCAKSGGGCGGFIGVTINVNLNHVVEVVCPKCGHKHQRRIKDGVLTDLDRYINNPTEELCPTPAAWSKKPRQPESKKRIDTSKEREAVVIDNPIARDFLNDRRFEIHGNLV